MANNGGSAGAARQRGEPGQRSHGSGPCLAGAPGSRRSARNANGGRHRCQPPVAGRQSRGVATWSAAGSTRAGKGGGLRRFGHRGRGRRFAGNASIRPRRPAASKPGFVAVGRWPFACFPKEAATFIDLDAGSLRHRSSPVRHGLPKKALPILRPGTGSLRRRSPPARQHLPKKPFPIHQPSTGSLRRRSPPARHHLPKKALLIHQPGTGSLRRRSPPVRHHLPKKALPIHQPSAGSLRRRSTFAVRPTPPKRSWRHIADLRPTPARSSRPPWFVRPARLRLASESMAAQTVIPQRP